MLWQRKACIDGGLPDLTFEGGFGSCDVYMRFVGRIQIVICYRSLALQPKGIYRAGTFLNATAGICLLESVVVSNPMTDNAAMRVLLKPPKHC
jgi:hypothetical protein